MSITMKELAKIAGVNVSTVSRALNNDNYVSEEVRKKVIAIANKYNYKKRKIKKQNILYLIDKRFFLLTSSFYNPIIESMGNNARLNGYGFEFQSLEPDQFSLKNISTKNIAGMLITSWHHEEFIRELKDTGMHIVLVDFYLPNMDIPAVLSDKIDGVVYGIEYLASLGHKRIAYLEGDISIWGARDRIIGYKRAIEMFDLEKDDNLLLSCEISINGAYETFKDYLKTCTKLPTAVMGANDLVAIGAMEAIKEFNLRIPDDISVLGSDDISLAEEVIPKLSTMEVKKNKMGELAVQQLIQIIDKKSPFADKLLLRPRLIVRNSTGYIHSPMN